jgi:hypothetical protein
LKDISLGGAFVICREPIALNEKFRLYVEVPDEETFALNAEMVWSNMNMPEEKRLEKAISRHLREAKLTAV